MSIPRILDVEKELVTIERGPALMGKIARLGQIGGLERIGINYLRIQAGSRSSFAHCHEKEEEFVYVISGTAKLWLNGHTQEITAGQCISFPAGTGVAHTFLNDINADGKEGEDLVLLVVGEKIQDDKWRYPLNPEINEELKPTGQLWEDMPNWDIGPDSATCKGQKQ